MNKELPLADVLEDYALETPVGNNLEILRSMMEKYPQFREELMDFAASRAQIRYTPEPEISVEEEARYKQFGLENLNFFLKGEAASAETLASLTEVAKERGLNRTTLASKVGVSLSLVMYLEKKRLRFSSIPKAIIARLANVLEVSETVIANYLNQLPDLATNASFKSQTRPEELEQKDFADAVRQDQSLSRAQKAELLKL